MSEIKLHETQWAVMQPDVYGGPRCDQIKPRWYCTAEGDMGGGDHQRKLVLDARLFSPGTKITISEPACPTCCQVREPKYPTPKRGPLYAPRCDCGFDWDEWTRNQYS